MLSVFIAVAVGAVAGYFSKGAFDSIGWGITCGIFSTLLMWLIISLILRKAINGRQLVIQNIMMDAQNKVNRQLEMFNRRPPSSMNAARQMLEKIQFAGINKALAEMNNFKVFYPWSPMLSRQINTMRMQLYYQLREYDKVDALLPKALLIDVQSLAMKMARMYKLNDAKLDKFYAKHRRRMKGEDGAFFASVYAWIKVKQETPDAALAALRMATKTSDNQIVLENIDRLVNGKIKHFSNAGFGDMWYVLALEEPKVKNTRQQGRPF